MLRFRVWGLGVGVRGWRVWVFLFGSRNFGVLGFGVEVLGLGVWGLVLGVWAEVTTAKWPGSSWSA